MKTTTVSHQDGKTQNQDKDSHEPHLPTPTGQDGQANSAAAGNVPAPDASASTAMDNMLSPTLDAGKGLLSLHHGIDDGLPAISYELSPPAFSAGQGAGSSRHSQIKVEKPRSLSSTPVKIDRLEQSDVSDIEIEVEEEVTMHLYKWSFLLWKGHLLPPKLFC